MVGVLVFDSSWDTFCISFITGSPGSGKSFCLVRDLYARLAEFRFPIVTNLPIEVEAFAEAAAKRYGREVEEIRNQFALIPRDVAQRWKSGDTTPAELVHTPEIIGLESIRGALFVLDECHLFCPKRSKPRQAMWESWLGEVRHEGWSGMYFISQDRAKVGESIIEHAELSYELTNNAKRRDPFFAIEQQLWWQLRGAYMGEYRASIGIDLYRRLGGKLKPQAEYKVSLDPFFFPLYRSHQAAGGGTVEEAHEVPKQEYEKRPRWWWVRDDDKAIAPTWAWFLGRTWLKVVPRLGLAAFVVWVCFLGGGILGMRLVMGYFRSFAPGSEVTAQAVELEPTEPGAIPVNASIENGEVLSRQSAEQFANVISELSREKQAVVVQQLEEVERRYQAEREAIEEEEKAKQEREQRKRRDLRVVAFDRTRAWLSDGTEVFEGESVLGGMLDGLQVVEIQRGRRRVRFSDGLVLGMGRPNGLRDDEGELADVGNSSQSEASPATNGRAGLSGALRTGSGGRVSGE